MRTVRLQFIVFDEIDSALGQLAGELRGRCRGEAYAGFDDRADQRPVINAAKTPRASYAELRPAIPVQKFGRQLEIEQPQPGERVELPQIPGDSGHEIG